MTSDANSKSKLLPVLLTHWLYIRGSHDPLLGDLIDLLEWLTEVRKPVYLLDYWFITEVIKGYE